MRPRRVGGHDHRRDGTELDPQRSRPIDDACSASESPNRRRPPRDQQVEAEFRSEAPTLGDAREQRLRAEHVRQRRVGEQVAAAVEVDRSRDDQRGEDGQIDGHHANEPPPPELSRPWLAAAEASSRDRTVDHHPRKHEEDRYAEVANRGKPGERSHVPCAASAAALWTTTMATAMPRTPCSAGISPRPSAVVPTSLASRPRSLAQPPPSARKRLARHGLDR